MVAAAPYGCAMAGWVRIGGAATVLYGPGDIGQAHSANEYVDLETTERVCRVQVRATTALLEGEPASLTLRG